MHSHLLVLTTPFTSTRFPTSLPLALDDCMFHTFRRIPVWEYQTDQQLLKGLLDALAAHKALCDEGVLHGRINPETVFLVGAVAGSEQGAAGFLDATHIDEDAVAASRSAAAVNDTGAGPLQFESRRLLWHIAHGRTPVQRSVADDVESFYWVLLYAVLRNLAANMGVPVGPTASSSVHPS
ncbi:hypothetical protein VTO73DRAFT_12056 [Trametes versicolor]